MINMYRNQFQELFELEIAENGLQAVQIVASNPRNYFDIIILAINMPIMDGFEAVKLIQNIFEPKNQKRVY